MKEHQFGGSWTDRKLKQVKEYLGLYLKALKNQQFNKIYIDGFAGTGYRTKLDSTNESILPFDEDELSEMAAFQDGSARIALQFNPGFDKYIFIEKDNEKCKELEKLKTEFPKKAAKIAILKNDANEAVASLCAKSNEWKYKRAVIFLDPYGLQVEWKTLECVSKIQGIDLWYLFPIGAIFRLLRKDGALLPSNSARLDAVFGTHEWYDIFYSKIKSPGLFDNAVELQREANVLTIMDFLVKRLESIFAGVSKKPAILRNTKKNSPMFLLCFAMTNPSIKAKDLALPLAGYVLKDEDV